MSSGTLTVRVTGPLAKFAAGFAEELDRRGYAYPSACELLRVLAHLSRWMVLQSLEPAELTRPRLMQFVTARREAGYRNWRSERGLR